MCVGLKNRLLYTDCFSIIYVSWQEYDYNIAIRVTRGAL